MQQVTIYTDLAQPVAEYRAQALDLPCLKILNTRKLWDVAVCFNDSERQFVIDAIWSSLGEVLTDDDGCIEEDWLFFEAGDDREEIWAWIEEAFDCSIAELMSSKNKVS